MTGEIVPVSAGHSRTHGHHIAALAIDLDLDTYAQTTPNRNWDQSLEISLDQETCVKQVIKYSRDGNPSLTWTCSDSDCSYCQGSSCGYFTLTVYTAGPSGNVSTGPDCKVGDRVKLQRLSTGQFLSYEIAIIGQGSYQISSLKYSIGLNLTGN